LQPQKTKHCPSCVSRIITQPDTDHYPEIIPEEFHARVLYRDHQELIRMLLQRLQDVEICREMRCELSAAMGRFAWESLIERYDAVLENLGRRSPQDFKPIT